MKCKLADIAEFNPKETIKKGTVAKKIAMDKLRPFCRDIPEYELAPFTGGAKFRNGDTIMARITPCLENGKTAKVNVLETGEVGFGSTEFLVFRANKNITDEDYLYYLVCSPIVRDIAIKSMIGSSGRQRVQTDVVQNIEIDLPSLGNQKRIGNLLRSLDDKIELNNKINANLEQQAQALFKAWFVDFEPFDGKMPEDWQEIPLEKLCEVVTKGTTPTTFGKPFTEQGVNFIKGETIQENHTFDLQKMSHISDETNQLLKRSIIHSDDILFTIAGTLGRFAMVDEDLLPANTNQAVCIIRSSSERVSPIFLYSFFIGNWHNEFYAKRVQQAVQQNLSLGTIKSLPILIPPSKELGVYCDLLGPILKQVKQNEIENRRLTMLRNVLLPRLMSGKVLV